MLKFPVVLLNVIYLLFTGFVTEVQSTVNLTDKYQFHSDQEATDIIYQLHPNQLLRYDYDWIFGLINRICRDASNVGDIQPSELPEAKNMRFMLLKSRTENYSIPLEKSEELWSHPKFDKNLNTVILITGWLTNYNSSSDDRQSMYTVADAYFCREDTNFVILDPSKYLDTLYHWAAFNTDVIGKLFSQSLASLVQTHGYSIKKIHLIGNSLGAHIAGSIGKHYTKRTGQVLPHITGLDPANPCFNKGEVLSGLQIGDADFIDIIHTNPGGAGQREPLGDIDFYPNGFAEQPGCTSIVCAHNRAWEFYAESTYRENAQGFLAVRCTSMEDLENGNCNGPKYPMGFNVPHNVKGTFFLKTNSASPFGEFSVNPADIKCNVQRFYY